jgi:succinyl-CoA synthetase beta subunit
VSHLETEQKGLPLIPDVPFPQVGSWSETQSRLLLQEAGIPIIPGQLTTTAEEAVKAASVLGLPVAMKIQSAEIIHKSDIGGVALHLASEEAVRQCFRAMIEQVQTARPDASIDGILVSPMRSSGTELLVSVIRDPLWGSVLTIGLGGIWTEALNDTAVRILPVEQDEIMVMLNELRGVSVLRGDRGHAPADLHAVSKVVYHISELAHGLGPQLAALEINPLWIDGSQVEVLDVLIHWQ